MKPKRRPNYQVPQNLSLSSLLILFLLLLLPCLLPQTLNLSGPIAPNILDPPKDEVTTLASKVPTPILMKSFLLVLNALDKVPNPPAILPDMKSFAAVPALAASKKANPAPVSSKFIEKERFLRDTLFAPRLATIDTHF
tara:strand:+ start:18 stop:434 length:417 start_codon:yes stop_codon:yes gene_type:complete